MAGGGMIEIIARDTCPTCGGTGEITTHPVNVSWLAKTEDCDRCHGVGTVPRVLATFADAEELRDALYATPGFEDSDANFHAVLAPLGVSDEN